MSLVWKLICCSMNAKVRWNKKKNKNKLPSWASVWDYKALVEQEQFLMLKL